MEATALLNVDIRKTFGPAKKPFQLAARLVAMPGFTILFGASGAGKSTLLDCVAGIATPDEGRIETKTVTFFDSATGTDLPPQERRVGYVFQDLALFPHLSVESNVRYGIAGEAGRRRCREILESFRIAHLAPQKPGQISGGERQRVALARALVTYPRVLLLDEPLAALDLATRSAIIADLRVWNQDHKIPILYVTHSRDEVFALGESAVVLAEGSVIAQGTPHQVMTAPDQETVAQLVGFENIFDVTVSARHEDRGTMTCRVRTASVELETPLVRAEPGTGLRIGIRAGDVLLAARRPEGLSAQNIIFGTIVSLAQKDVMTVARVDCGVEVEVHLTLAARDTLGLRVGLEVWLIVKTYSCHLMRMQS